MNPRIKWLRNQLESLKLDGMIVSNPTNIKYLTGLDAEGLLVLAPKENIFITDGRYIEDVNCHLTLDDEIVVFNMHEMSKYDYEGIFMISENVGFEEGYVTYEQYKKYLQQYQVNLVETEGLIESQRIIKDDDEIKIIQKACSITDDAFDHIKSFIEEGMTEKEIAFELERYMVTHGADGLAFETIVAFTENASKPHAVPSDRKLKRGDLIQFDFGAKVDGYCSDFSRAVFAGEIDPKYKQAYSFVLDQQTILAESLKDGASIKQAIKDRESDYKLRNIPILHAFGHGVGIDIHEKPFLRSNTESLIKENSIIAIEPGYYSPGEFGIRIEDTFVVTKTGSRPLTHSSKDLTVIKLS